MTLFYAYIKKSAAKKRKIDTGSFLSPDDVFSSGLRREEYSIFRANANHQILKKYESGEYIKIEVYGEWSGFPTSGR